MSTDSAEFLLKMIDGASGPAGGAMASIRAMNQSLAALNAAQRLAGGGSIELHDKILQQKSAIDSLKAALPALTAAEQASAAAAKAAASEQKAAKAAAVASAKAAGAAESAAAKAAAADVKAAAVAKAAADRASSAEQKSAARSLAAEQKSAARAAAAEQKAAGRATEQAARAAAAAAKAAAREQEQAVKQAARAAVQAAKDVERAQKKAAEEAVKAAKKVSEAAKAQSDAMTSSVNAAGGPVSSLAGKFESLKDALSTSSGATALFVSGSVAVVAACAAMVAAITAVIGVMSVFALRTADAHQAFLRTMVGAAGSAKAAGELQAALERVADSSPLAKDQIEGFAHSLAVAGLKGKQFEETLRSMSTVTAIVGPEAAGHLQGIIDKASALGHFEVKAKGLKGLGISMEDLAGAMGMSVKKMEAAMKAGKISTEAGIDAMNKAVAKRFGGEVAGAAMGFAVQMQKLKDKIADLFEDLNIKPFLTGLKSIVAVFDQSTSSGKALKMLVTTVFNSIFSAAGAALPFVAALLKGMVIGALQFYIAAKQVGKELGLAGAHAPKWLTLKNAVAAGVVVFKILAVAVIAVAAVVAIAIASFLLFAAFVIVGVGIIVGAVVLVVKGIMGIVGAGIAAGKAIGSAFSGIGARIKGAFAGLSLSGIASNLATSFISAIKGSIGKVVAAMTALGGAAMSALKSVLGIASPSKVMIEAGGHTATGFAQGIEKGTDKVSTSSAKMGAAVQPGAAPGGKGAGGDRFVFTNCQFFDTSETALRTMLSKILDGEIAASAEPAS